MSMRMTTGLLLAFAGAFGAQAQDSVRPQAPRPAAQAPKPAAQATPKPAAAKPAKPKPETSAAPAAKPAVPAAAPPANGTAAKASPALREAYASMPLAERLSIQSDLIWTGDYNGGVSGEFGERAIAAVKAFQKKNKGAETGILTPQERAALAAMVKAQREQVGWKIVEDHVMTGVWLGIPAKLATQASRGKTGGRWASARGEIQIETFREHIEGSTLSASFEQQKKTPAGRRVEYSVLRPDFYVVSGLQGLKKFYVRAQLKDNDLRGMTILYDQAMEGIMEPVVVAMSSAFAPFDGGTAMPGIKRFVEYATAVAVSRNGYLVTDRMATESCHALVVPGLGRAERVAEDKESDLALLRVYGATNGIMPIGLSTQPPSSAELMLIGIKDPQSQDGGGAISAANARIRGAEGGLVAIEPAPPSGFSGAAVLDAQGQFVGLAGLKAASQATLVSAATIRNFLAAQSVTPAGGQVGMDAARAAVARVICVRK